MGFWTRLFGGRRDAGARCGDENVSEVHGIPCKHVRGNVYDLEGVRYKVNALDGTWKCLRCGATGRTSRVPSTRTVLENLGGHHLGCHTRTQ